MTSVESKAAAPPPPRRPFQFDLRTLLLLFVVLGSSMAVFGVGGIVVFLLVVGLAVYLREANSRLTLVQLLVVLVVIAGLFGLLLPAVQSAREMSRYSQCRNYLKQLVLALLDYERAHGSLPPAYTVDNNGKPMHSWRTLILPELDLSNLYKACDFTKPWDAPKNKTISSMSLTLYKCPSDPDSYAPGAAQTNYFAVVGPNAAWAGDKPRKLDDLGKDASHTVLLVELADAGIAWAEPKDVSLDELRATNGKPSTLRMASNHRPADSFFYTYNNVTGVGVALADGSVSFLRTDNLSLERLRQILEIGGFTDDVMASQTGLSDTGGRLNWPNIAALAVWLVSVGALLMGAERGRTLLAATSQSEILDTILNPK